MKEGVMTSRMLILPAVLVGSVLVLSAPTSASAVGASVVSKSTCTQGTNAMLTLSHDDGHVEAEMELHADKAGHIWKVRFYNETEFRGRWRNPVRQPAADQSRRYGCHHGHRDEPGHQGTLCRTREPLTALN
jgi:hypothetical protein